jgi:hypothetical protein
MKTTIWPKFKGESNEACQKYSAKSSTALDMKPINTKDLQILLKMPFGVALPTSVNISGQVATAILFRESAERIKELDLEGALLSMHTRSALLGVNNVVLYVTLFRLGDQIFEIWWNWHNQVHRRLFERLFEQDEISFGFVSEQPKFERILRHASTIKEGLRANRSTLTTAKSWTMAEFEEARSIIYKQYPTPVSLWQALGRAEITAKRQKGVSRSASKVAAMDFSRDLWGFLKDRKKYWWKWLALGLLLVVLALAVWLIQVQRQAMRKQRAAATLEQVRPELAFPGAGAEAARALEQVVRDHPGTKSAREAQLLRDNLLFSCSFAPWRLGVRYYPFGEQDG